MTERGQGDEVITDEEHKCEAGFVYADHVEQLRMRGLDPDLYPNARFAMPCPICTAKKFAENFGGREMTWRNWEERDDLADAVSEFLQWCPRAENWACLIHASKYEPQRRNGKTHALSAGGVSYIRAGKRVRYWNAASLYADRFESPLDPLAEFKGLALLDDLGNEADNPSTRDSLDRVLDSRYRGRRPSIVTSHLGLEALEKRYPRFLSRLNSGTKIEWHAEPYFEWKRRVRAEQQLARTASPQTAEPPPESDFVEQIPFEYAREQSSSNTTTREWWDH